MPSEEIISTSHTTNADYSLKSSHYYLLSTNTFMYLDLQSLAL